MKLATIPEILIIITVPVLLFLCAFNYYAFNPGFYKEKFSQYKVYDDFPAADSINSKVIGFITGKDDVLPEIFNQRERQHLSDVRKAIGVSRTVFYSSIAAFALLLFVVGLILKDKVQIIELFGRIMLFGGLLTLALSGLLLFAIASDFSGSFESFHQLLFKSGTYSFDPSTEIIVRLYPEQLFMDIGSSISKAVIFSSSALVILGGLALFKNKKNKNTERL